MKSYFKILIISLTLIVSAFMFPKQGKAQQENVNFQIFYDQLSPYGQWVNNPNYGYVWIPDVGEDFAPYSTSGHWCLQTMDGHGCRIMNGAGLHFIMDAGISMIRMDGFGFRIINGALHG